MVGGVHYRHPGLWVKATTTLDVLSRRPGLARASGRPGTRRSRVRSASRSRRSASASSCSRRRCASPTRCGGRARLRGGASRAATSRPTRLLNSPAVDLAGRASRSWSAAAASGRRSASSPSTPTRATCSARPRRSPASTPSSTSTAPTSGATRPRSSARPSRTSGSGRPARRGRETPQQVVDRFGELADAGAEHVILELKDVHEPAYLEQLGRDVLPALQALPDVTQRDTPRGYAGRDTMETMDDKDGTTPTNPFGGFSHRDDRCAGRRSRHRPRPVARPRRERRGPGRRQGRDRRLRARPA